MEKSQLLYTLALQHAPKVGDITAKKLIAHCGSAEAVFKETKQNLLKINGIGSFLVANLQQSNLLQEAEQELRFIEDQKIICHYFTDVGYPKHLKNCVDGPILLFQTGQIAWGDNPIISIVGTRKITTSGIAFTNKLIEELAVFNPIIVSGFAYGTDITAQKAALKKGLQTIGCLAHGLNQIYPKPHKKYVAEVEKSGGFLTDFWSLDAFDRNNFLKRNRVIAGVSEATIVIESAEKGGSLVTADIANSYNREVFAVPGRITDSQSEGCNNLIKHQKAYMLTNPMDVPYLLNWKIKNKEKPAIQKQLFVPLNNEENLIYNYLLENSKQQLDAIALQCNLPTFKVASVLLNLELKGVVRSLPGKFFEAI